MSIRYSHIHVNTLTIDTPLQYILGSQQQIKYKCSNKRNTLNYQISIKVLDNQIASNLHKQYSSRSSELDEISSIEKELGIVLKPVHPHSSDPSLTPYFIVEVSDKIKAEQVVNRFKGSRLIDAAYIKPSDEPPSTSI